MSLRHEVKNKAALGPLCPTFYGDAQYNHKFDVFKYSSSEYCTSDALPTGLALTGSGAGSTLSA